MKNYTKYLFVLLAALLMSHGYARVPANLAGTDIFPETMTIGEGANALEIETKLLNLSYGAEFFTICAQPLYNFGEVVRLGEDGRSNLFYKDIVTKEPLDLETCNPLAILMRALFWQNPGTSSLGDFIVSKRCCVINNTGTINLAKTLEQWAKVIAVTLYKISGIKPSQKMKKDVYTISNSNCIADGLKKNSQIFAKRAQKPDLEILLSPCIKWSEANNFGKDFPLRILMGGVYALVGDKQDYIFTFYGYLKEALKKVIPTLDIRDIGILIEVPNPFAKEEILIDNETAVAAPDEQHAFTLLQHYLGNFQPLICSTADLRAHNNVFFSDCFETTLRNSVLFLLQGNQGELNKELVSDRYQDFFTQYDSMHKQTTQKARDAWAELMSKQERALYAKVDYTYELEPSFIQLLFFLNQIFDLNVDDFTEHVISINRTGGENNKAFIEQFLPKINAALKEKLALEDDPIKVKSKDLSDLGSSIIDLIITNKKESLGAKITVGSHAEIIPQQNQDNDINAKLSYLRTEKFSSLGSVLSNQLHENTKPFDGLGFLMKPLNIEFFVPYFDKTVGVRRILYAAIARDYDLDRGVFINSLIDLIKALKIEKGNNFFEYAVTAATEGVRNTDHYVRNDALNLFKALFEKDHGFDKAVAVAIECVRSTDYYVRGGALNLFKALVDKDHGFDPVAVAAATEGVESSVDYLQNCALNLFKALVEKDHGFDEIVVAAATEGVESSVNWLQNCAMDLFKALVEKGHGFDEAVAAATKGIKSSVFFQSGLALNLFKALFKKGQGFDQARACLVELSPDMKNKLESALADAKAQAANEYN